MTFSVLGDLNWLAVIVAAIVYFALGGLWFSPVAFGKQWQDAIGWNEADGLVVGIGLVGSGLFVTGFFDPRKPKPQTWIVITAGYHVIGLLVAAVILALWT